MTISLNSRVTATAERLPAVMAPEKPGIAGDDLADVQQVSREFLAIYQGSGSAVDRGTDISGILAASSQFSQAIDDLIEARLSRKIRKLLRKAWRGIKWLVPVWVKRLILRSGSELMKRIPFLKGPLRSAFMKLRNF